ncbi:MAG: choice-of-anchor I family protein [Saprospiraceae bacterium]
MKKALQLVCSLSLLWANLYGQTTGDLSFVAWNADGNDGFAMVTFVDLAPNTLILFRDEEWAGSTFVGTGEGQAEWNTGSEVIPAGTVILFDELSATDPVVSYGSLSNTDIGISSSSEGIFCFLGVDTQTPVTFICAAGNASVASAFGTLDGTGLTEGGTAITYESGVDIAEYVGPRSGLDVNGYRLALNDPANYITQDGSGDQHNDGIAPDAPFDTTPFVIATEDVTPPAALNVTVVNATTLTVTFSEPVTNATEVANYQLMPAVAIQGVVWDAATQTATITHAGFVNAVSYTLTISQMMDAAGNVQPMPQVFGGLLVNDQLPNLRFTEIMYNPPAGADTLEFVEIWNFEATDVEAGGFVFRDEGSFYFTFPAMTIPANSGVLLATHAAGAELFYGVSFMDLPGNGNLLGNGGEDLVLENSLGMVIDSVSYDDAAPWPLAADGGGPSLTLIDPALDANVGTSWMAASQVVGQVEGTDVMANPGVYEVFTAATVSFEDDHSIFVETDGTAVIPVQIVGNNGTGSFTLTVEAGDAFAGEAFTIGTTTFALSELPTGNATVDVQVVLNDNATAHADSWVSWVLTAEGATVGSIDRHVLYIQDDETEAPEASGTIDLEHIGSYLVEMDASAEIVAYDGINQRLFVTNSISNTVHILDFTDPYNINETSVLDVSVHGDGINSVAIHDGVAAMAVERDDANGVIVLWDFVNIVTKVVDAGNLPDHVSFTPDGSYVLSANEGEPNADYTIDPEGSVTIVDMRNGVANATAQTANFNAFDANIDALRDAGVRIFGPGASVSQDMEPEYITYNSAGTIAYVGCQENNAIARVDIASATIDAIVALGYKNHSLPGNTLDASDRTDGVVMANWPVWGMYHPDAIASFEVNGINYIVTANEGDARDYDGFSEETSIEDVVLDAAAFPDAAALQSTTVLGRLNITTANGDTDGDGDYDELYAFGGRSISIWDIDAGLLVWDSGDDLERITATDPVFGVLFNASNSNNNFKNRSDNKGPEPEGITTAEINGVPYVFVTLERTGGVVTYDVSNPAAPVFVDYINTRTLGDDEGGDLGPEGVIYIPAADSPVDTGLVVMSNEVSATLSVFKVSADIVVDVDDIVDAPATLNVYPNPVQQGVAYFSRPVDFTLYDAQGRALLSGQQAPYVKVDQLPAGAYLLKTADGVTTTVVVAK